MKNPKPDEKVLPATTRPSLLELAEAGDAGAWGELFALYHAWLLKFLVSGGWGRYAEDVVAKILGDLPKKLASFNREGQGKFRAWLKRVAMNAAADEYRRNRDLRAAEGGRDGQLAHLPDSPDRLSARWEAEHDAGLVLEALDEAERDEDIGKRDVQLFRMVRLNGTPTREAAKHLNMTDDAARKSLQRVTAKLRNRFKGVIDGF